MIKINFSLRLLHKNISWFEITRREHCVTNKCRKFNGVWGKLLKKQTRLQSIFIWVREYRRYRIQKSEASTPEIGFLYQSIAFFSVGVKGNSTCLISSQLPTLQNLEAHPEYDVYAIKRQDLLPCDFHRFYRGFARESENRSTKTNKSIRKGSTMYINKYYPFSKFGIGSMPVLISQNALSFSR